MGQKTLYGEARRLEILTAINMYYEIHGFAPTVRELAKMVGLKSTSTMHRNLRVLKEDGKISWNKEMPRTIRVL